MVSLRGSVSGRTCKVYFICLTLVLLVLAATIKFREHTEPETEQRAKNSTEQRIGLLRKTRGTRNVNKRSAGTLNCLKKVRGIVVNYQIGTNTGFKFDLCTVIKCWGGEENWRGYPVYLSTHTTPTRAKWPANPPWKYVFAYTGKWQPTCDPSKGAWRLERCPKKYIQLERLAYSQKGHYNPMLLNIKNLTTTVPKRTNYGAADPCKGDSNTIYLVLGVSVQAKDPAGIIQINLVQPVTPTAAPAPKPAGVANNIPQQKGVVSLDYNKVTLQNVVRLVTAYQETNLWYDYLTINARLAKPNQTCIACASARPHLISVPGPVHLNDSKGWDCLTALWEKPGDPTGNCSALAKIYPYLKPSETPRIPPVFSIIPGNYTCFNNTGKGPCMYRDSNDDYSWCQTILPGVQYNASRWTQTRGDLYWFCGGGAIFFNLPGNWSGVCASIRLVSPVTIISADTMQNTVQATVSRSKRELSKTLVQQYLDANPTYMDSIGVPRGVPDEHKLVDEIATGFESIFIFITVNKNVNRINYIYYNMLRFFNITEQALGGLAEQLAPTSLMALQNRMALDMLLAEKGGVCAMIGDTCCTIIPNNTAPDGSVTRALAELRALSIRSHEMAGADNPITAWIRSMFGKYTTLIVSAFTALFIVLCVLAFCGCCCIPFLRALVARSIDAALRKSTPIPSALRDGQLCLWSDDPAERESLLEEWGMGDMGDETNP